MRLNVKWLTALIILAALPMSGCGFMQKLRARDNVNKGVKAFTDQKYSAAAQYFEKAIELDPEFETARMYLATTYTSQFIPGSADPKSEEMGQKGISTFKEIVDKCKDLSSENCKNAMLSIASLYYQMRQYPESKEWCNRILKVDGSNAEAYYRIAVIDFDDTFEKTGVQGEMVSLMTQEETEEALKSIEEGLTCLSKALEIKPNYFDAMEYQNLLWREKAKFETDEDVKADLIRQADLVSQKALVLKLKAQEEKAKRPKRLGVGGT